MANGDQWQWENQSCTLDNAINNTDTIHHSISVGDTAEWIYRPYYIYPTVGGTTTTDNVVPVYIRGGDGGIDIINTNQERKEKPKMRGLYQVYVVDSESDEVIFKSDPFVANDSESAARKAIRLAGSEMDDNKDLDEYDFVVQLLGDVRRKKEVQKVEVIKE